MFVAGGEDGWTNRRHVCLWVSSLSPTLCLLSPFLLPLSFSSFGKLIFNYPSDSVNTFNLKKVKHYRKD